MRSGWVSAAISATHFQAFVFDVVGGVQRYGLAHGRALKGKLENGELPWRGGSDCKRRAAGKGRNYATVGALVEKQFADCSRALDSSGFRMIDGWCSVIGQIPARLWKSPIGKRPEMCSIIMNYDERNATEKGRQT